MSNFIPLIRADVLAPALRWMINHGRDVEAALQAVNLAWYPWHDPHALIPVRNGAEFFYNLGRSEGPDVAFRVVAETGVADIGLLGNAIAHCPTPRSALKLASAMMAYQCTHEVLDVSKDHTACVVIDKWAFSFKNQETRHLVAQYVLALINKIVRSTGKGVPCLRTVRMVPHPEHGLEHLRPWLRCALEADVDAPLKVVIPADIADHPFVEEVDEPVQEHAILTQLPLRGEGTMAGCVTLLAKGMVRHGSLTLGEMAATTGLSRRTLQRRLAEDGVTFSDIVEAIREDLATKALGDPNLSLQELSGAIGYAHQSTLTRAMRRWTGKTPSLVRGESKS